MFRCDDRRVPSAPIRSTRSAALFRARAAAASQPAAARLSPADADCSALISLAVGIGFVAIGAWPVSGFSGSTSALVYLAFRLNYRSARQRETLRLADDDFTVERVSIRGERRIWRFQPFWLRVILEERPDESNRLLVASHGSSLVIGDFVLARHAARAGARRLRDALPAGAIR